MVNKRLPIAYSVVARARRQRPAVGSMPFERGDPVAKPIVADDQGLPAPVADEGAAPLEAGRDRGLIVLDDEAGGGIVPFLGVDRDQRAVIFLAIALEEDVAGDPADRALGQVDHIIGVLPLA